MPYALSLYLETTVPFQDRTVCKGIIKAPPDMHTFLMYLSWTNQLFVENLIDKQVRVTETEYEFSMVHFGFQVRVCGGSAG